MADEDTYSTFKLEEVEPRHGIQWFRGQVPNGLSGVVAGTYGDSTHVSRVTVDALGIVRFAENVAIQFPDNAGTNGQNGQNGTNGLAGVDLDPANIPLAGNSAVFTHGLGAVPTFYQLFLLCTVDQGTFVVDDQVDFASIHDEALGVSCNATTITVTRRSTAANITLTEQAGGVSLSIDPARWIIIGFAAL